MEPKHYNIAVHEAERRLEEAGYVRGINAALKALPKELLYGADWPFLDAETQRLKLARSSALDQARAAIENIKHTTA